MAWVYKILAWVAWVYKMFYGSKSWHGPKTISIFFAFRSFSLHSKCSLHVFVPDIRPFVFLMFISYSNWFGFKIIYRP